MSVFGDNLKQPVTLQQTVGIKSAGVPERSLAWLQHWFQFNLEAQ